MEKRYYDNGFADISRYGDIKNCSDQLPDLEKVRISALRKAAEISPYVTEVTIGPNKTEKTKTDMKLNLNNHEFIDLIGDKLSDDLRHTLILKENEAKLKEDSEELFKNLVEKMMTQYTEWTHRFWKNQSDKWKTKSLELRARKLQMAKQMQENDNLNVLEKTKLDEKKCQLINSQTIENMNRLLDEQNKATARFALITDSHAKICICYNDILNLMDSNIIAKQAIEKYIQDINSIIENISNIMKVSESGTITEKEVKKAEIFLISIENIKSKIIEDINLLNQQEELRKRQEEQARRAELENKRLQDEEEALAAIAKEKENKRVQQMFYSEKNYAHYNKLAEYLNEYENKYKDLMQNSMLKKFRFDCQKAVNTPVNALSSVSGAHIRDKYEKLAKLLRGEKVQVLDTYVTASQHPQAVYYCTALLAKKIVRQGELSVSSNPEAAFPLAAVVVALWSQFPEFGQVLAAYFHKYCPYLVPMLLPQKEGQSDKEFYLSRGYTYSDEGVVEKQDKFLKRMSGIFKLQCAIWIAKTPRFLNSSNPHGLRFGWQWIASFINLKAEPDICATLILDFFTVCGSEFLKIYKQQSFKLVKLISTDYLTILERIDEGGPKTRLEVFLQNVIKSGYIDSPSGQLAPNTW